MTILLKVISKRKEVIDFLKELNEIIGKDDFDIDSSFVLIRKNKLNDETHSTTFTLLDLNYDVSEVIARINELTISEYSETLLDKDDVAPPKLYVFGKKINEKLVYIKLKIKGDQKRRILCVSFHYARDPMIFPFAVDEKRGEK